MKRRVSTAKRIVAVALAATVAVSLTGCKKRKDTNDTTSSDVTTSQSQAAVPETPEVTPHLHRRLRLHRPPRP